MNKTIRYVGLFAILPILTIALSSDYIGTAEAGGSSVKVHSTGLAQGYQSYQGEPFVELVSVTEFSAKSLDTARATVKAQAGNFDITDVQILVKSDIDSSTISINGIQAFASSITNVMLKVKDPSSISAQILNYQIND